MINRDVKTISSNQIEPHKNLQDLVKKHLSHSFTKPYQAHTLVEFARIKQRVEQEQKPLIFDSCCGVGESSLVIAKRHPEALVIGLDKSQARLDKNSSYQTEPLPDNLILARVNLNDFWRLAVEAGWTLSHHYLLYPNPWPKSKHLQRRWHGGPLFPYLVKLGGILELRSNWRLYVEEFAIALQVAGINTQVQPYKSASPMTPFERKYWQDGQQSWHLMVDLGLSSITI